MWEFLQCHIARTSVVRLAAQVALHEVGGDDPPRRFTAIEKGKGKKVLAKKRKAGDCEAEVAKEVAAAAEAAEEGGRSGALRIGTDLTPAQRRAVLEIEQ